MLPPPNGFYEESCMNHFPVNEYRTIYCEETVLELDDDAANLQWDVLSQLS